MGRLANQYSSQSRIVVYERSQLRYNVELGFALNSLLREDAIFPNPKRFRDVPRSSPSTFSELRVGTGPLWKDLGTNLYRQGLNQPGNGREWIRMALQTIF